MAKGMPSMLALLGLLAVAGYQNRDKLAGAYEELKSRSPNKPDGSPDVLGGIANTVGGLFGGDADRTSGSAGGGFQNILSGLGGGSLATGLNDLLGSFRNAGQADTADSWITPGVPTQGLRPDQVEAAIGDEDLNELSQRTGLSRAELIERLAKVIPTAVDEFTPEGRMPTDEDLRRRFI